VLSSQKDELVHHDRVKGAALLLPVVVFVGSGLCDSGVQLGDKLYFTTAGSEYFVLAIFICAALTGITYLTWMLLRGTIKLQWKQVLGGIALGIPNYGSLLFLMKALDHVPGGSSVVFPVTNIATVAGSTLLSVVIFREHLNRPNLIGLVFAGLCIVFIYLPQIMGLMR
jgi:multidrug transporter EmrE-like cation transporter